MSNYSGSSGGKQDRRKQLASLSFSEKLKILKTLRDRSKKIAASRSKSARGSRQAAVASALLSDSVRRAAAPFTLPAASIPHAFG